AGELAMATDKNIILTKLAVTEKAFSLFGSMVPIITNNFKSLLLHNKKLAGSIPKIYKGENYSGFPYVMMDYPASFDKENIFAVRTMFWWGNFISITLHISGTHKKYWEKNIFKKLKVGSNFFIALSENEWQHHFEADNYILFSLLTAEQKKMIAEKNFLKVSLKYELHHWNMMQSILPDGYKAIAELLIV
ncbi:MAG: hypothetical protein LH615_14365, partial [Ferruginibacter sp.]|nr:hypothetical protein [Ferruginibacter sp.]